VEEHACALTVVETAGGLFSPLDRGLTNFDLVRALRPAKVLLVAPDRLGVLHDVTTTLGFARVCGLPVDALVLATLGASGDSSTGENAAELAHLCIATPVAVFPHAAPSADGSHDAAQAVLRRLTSPTQTTSSKL